MGKPNLLLPKMQGNNDSLLNKSENSPGSTSRKLNYAVFLTPQQFLKCLQLMFCILIMLLTRDLDVRLLTVVTYSSFLMTGFLIWADLLELPQTIFSNKKCYLWVELVSTVIITALFGGSAISLLFNAWRWFPYTQLFGLHATVAYAVGGFTIWQELRRLGRPGIPQRGPGKGDEDPLEKREQQNLGELFCSVSVGKLNFESLVGATSFPKFVQLGFSWFLSVSTVHPSVLLIVMSNISILVTWTLLLCDMADVTTSHFSTKEYLAMQLILSVGAAPSLMMSSLILIVDDDNPAGGMFGLQAALAYGIGAFFLWEELKKRTETATSPSSDNPKIFLNSEDIFTFSKFLKSSLSEPSSEEAVVTDAENNKAQPGPSSGP